MPAASPGTGSPAAPLESRGRRIQESPRFVSSPATPHPDVAASWTRMPVAPLPDDPRTRRPVPASGHPDIGAAVPSPVSSDPDKAGFGRHRDDLFAVRRRRLIDDDLPWRGTALHISDLMDGGPHPHDTGGMEQDAQEQQQSDGGPEEK